MSSSQSVSLELDHVTTCVCQRHAIVLLHDARGSTRVRVRVSVDCADAISNDDRPSSFPGQLVDALVSCMEAAGNVVLQLVLEQGSGEALLRLRGENGLDDMYVPVDPGIGFLIVHRLRAGVVLNRRVEAPTDSTVGLPGAHDPLALFRPFLDELTWLPGSHE